MAAVIFTAVTANAIAKDLLFPMLWAIGLIVLAMSALVASSANAQTVANGPYYANPSWDQTLPSSTRFIILSNFGSAAVLDRETGLVWEKSPATTVALNWETARFHCTSRSIGGRKGWRLPSVHELASLIDASVPFPGLKLPPGQPFTNVQSGYLSATTYAANTNNAWRVGFQSGDLSASDKQFGGPVWCVRGGMNAEQY